MEGIFDSAGWTVAWLHEGAIRDLDGFAVAFIRESAVYDYDGVQLGFFSQGFFGMVTEMQSLSFATPLLDHFSR
jgi:hypothetical protein